MPKTGTIGDWPSHPNGKLPPAHVHEQASRPKFKARGLRLMDEDAAQHGPVRWIMRDGKPVDADGQQRKPLPNGG